MAIREAIEEALRHDNEPYASYPKCGYRSAFEEHRHTRNAGGGALFAVASAAISRMVQP
ncbi:hypothetical protein [Novosphingobium sp. Gsoil 351]|uniref:hypothetical protein n=1 Tax=Novosphingobium sp. Gsoil 351 TaxID=2675225 RepID=UPI0018A8292B|nr:hypothetical protein [Novosphingobium sp. Gsoil 351]